MPEFYQDVEDFILNAAVADGEDHQGEKAQIAVFLLSLLSEYKKRSETHYDSVVSSQHYHSCNLNNEKNAL